MKQLYLWTGALLVGTLLGWLQIESIDAVANVVATIYTRLFQLLAVPTIVLAIITTMATFGTESSGKLFGRTFVYTLLTTFAAAAVGAFLYVIIAPENLPIEAFVNDYGFEDPAHQSYAEHLLSVVPNNIVKPFLEGNVLSLLLLPDKTFSDLIYGIIMILISAPVVDAVLIGGRSAVQVMVFSDRYDEIADYIIHDLERGVTAIEAVGWYTQQERKVLLIVMRQKEIHDVTRRIKEIDRHAFISISPANNVYGEGFEEIKTGLDLSHKKEPQKD